MKKFIVAGNWKMYKNKKEAMSYILSIQNKIPNKNQITSLILPQNTLLDALNQIKGDNLQIGAQNVFYKNEGPYTGEISPQNIKSLGIKYVLLGHNERKNLFHETDQITNLKLLSVLEQRMYPIVCIGESLEVKKQNKTELILNKQLNDILQNVQIQSLTKIIFAYEPIWAINQSTSETPEKANQTIRKIKKLISVIFKHEISHKIRVIYGGSVSVANADLFFQQKEIDGILTGRSSLNAAIFLSLITKAQQNKSI
ncbi:triose-phosphate isomerase [Candidatus Phytoplasma melaleucae]|uniref:Triosephosphate isomerase n=1 Tax=Candidatus Phytoplasma melaleucae TaxID=2982630 RepID=A0ABT9DDW1_9MOLU|nr:triose-phosphate isomerase ['Melaleuca sp.' phytoplasma]MDO8168019.1 triose-phosphate isomerase ['Melaleuca sp.' phytoplasma]MDV3205457.1 triose-phosphate isomerase [Weeping tea tree witches'-broom phytoplasma]